MRLPADGRGAGLILVTVSALALAGCGTRSAPRLTSEPLPLHGPQADFPVVLGDPYTVGGVTHTPTDVLNYDQVGYLAADPGAAGVTAAHHTLPLPSYVEVTSLETGRTILVRVERRGPMDGADLLALSPGALEQLAAPVGSPVRVRRVNPPEDHRAPLRAGQAAPARMDTPMSLVEVLRRQLPSAPPLAAAPSEPAPEPDTLEAVPPEPQAPEPAPPPAPPPQPSTPAPAPEAPAPLASGFVVQAAAFSTEERARRAAEALGGTVSPSGRFFHVRTGPFATRAEAEASLAKVRDAGYSDARIFVSG